MRTLILCAITIVADVFVFHYSTNGLVSALAILFVGMCGALLAIELGGQHNGNTSN